MKTVYHPIETKQKKWKIWNVAREKKGKLNYVIAVPKNVAMITNLKHGNINMGDFYGNFTCNLDFGSLSANKFFNSPVCITGKYSNCKINEVDVLKFSADFANVNVSTSDTLNIKSKYTKYKIGKSRSVKAKCSFGDINVGSVDNFDANLEHTPTTVENLGKKLNFECSFSGININNSSKQLESVKFSGSYSNLKLSVDPDLSADLDVDLMYRKLSVDNKHNVKYSLSETTYNKIVRKGTIGNKTPTAKINLYSSFGSISIQ